MRTFIEPIRLGTMFTATVAVALLTHACGTAAEPEPQAATGSGGASAGNGAAQGGITSSSGGVVAAQGGTPPAMSSGGSTLQGGSPPAASGGTTTQGGSATSEGGSATVQGGSPPAQGGASAGGAATPSTGGVAPGGSGGVSGSAGSPASGGQAGGSGGSGGSGGGEPADLKDVAKALHGFVILVPCQGGSGETCGTAKAGQGCPSNSDLFQAGVRLTNETLEIGGTPGTPYTITLHFQGIVENRTYTGAMAPDGDQSTMLSNGFYVGGAPQTGTGDYNIYAIRVADPKKDYFLNAVGNTSYNRHQSFVIDYTGSIKVIGGSSVQMIAQDTNCTAIRNCTDPPDNNQCMSSGVTNLDPLITQKIGGNGSAYNGQFIGMTVTNVTSP